ncbi:hypothetical protein FOZ63_019706 [Perkinsus olseni]|uniref:Uncharacterized protein n=1 Tax=Perkinsus olseni TaxID=32597 RepID=A0A7J6SP87_PEROL|nr:hypothetical protein FOZ62_014878 [Perkinsus olseni]KAF4758005.1 hypothetical protein FOZ63_019706 [Perkinsus olseni]
MVSFFADAYGDGCFATYMKQRYWRGAVPNQLVFKPLAFFKTKEGGKYNCGDVYLSAADATDAGKLPGDGAKLIQFVKDFREQRGNRNGTVYLVYEGGAARSMTEDGYWAADFVSLFELLLAPYLQEEGPIGISFNAAFDKATWSRVFAAVEDARRYASLDWTRNYTFKVDARLDHSSNDKEAVDEVMRKADHVSVTTFSSNQTGLLDMYRTFLTSTCPHCNDKFVGSYKAKITFVARGGCDGSPHGESFCDYFMAHRYTHRDLGRTYFLVFSSEGIQKAHEELQASINAIPGKVIAEDKFDHLFEDNGTVMGLNDFRESRCIYGVDVVVVVKSISHWGVQLGLHKEVITM